MLDLPGSAELKAVTDALGEDHDLSTLRRRAAAAPEAFGGPEGVARLERAVALRQRRLRSRSRGFKKLFSKPSARHLLKTASRDASSRT